MLNVCLQNTVTVEKVPLIKKKKKKGKGQLGRKENRRPAFLQGQIVQNNDLKVTFYFSVTQAPVSLCLLA